MPTVHYGKLPEQDLLEIWNTDSGQFYREKFKERDRIYNTVFSKSSFDSSLVKLNEAFDDAKKAMPQAHDGCRVCHYLYDI